MQEITIKKSKKMITVKQKIVSSLILMDEQIKKNDMCYICMIDFIDCDDLNVIQNPCCKKSCCKGCYKLLESSQLKKCSCCKSKIKPFINYKESFDKICLKVEEFINKDFNDISHEEIVEMSSKVHRKYKKFIKYKVDEKNNNNILIEYMDDLDAMNKRKFYPKKSKDEYGDLINDLKIFFNKDTRFISLLQVTDLLKRVHFAHKISEGKEFNKLLKYNFELQKIYKIKKDEQNRY